MEKTPASNDMFSFFKDSFGVQDSLELQAHAEKVFEMVCVIKHQLTFFIFHSTLILPS